MSRLVWLAAVGHRAGRPTVGWEAGVGVVEEDSELFYGAGGAIGGGGGDGDGGRLLVGAAPFVGRVTGSECGTQRVSLGARAIGSDLELYRAPRFAVIGNLCDY